MKKRLLPAIALSSILLLGGCVASVGGGSRSTVHTPTLGQQLIDLQKARDCGAINDADYQIQKAKLLNK